MNRKAAWPLPVATEGRLVPVLMATASRSKWARLMALLISAVFTSVDVDGADEDVVTDHGEQAVGQIEEGELILGFGRQHPLDHRLEQLLIDDHRHHAEEDGEQGGEGQRLVEGLAEGVFLW